MVLPRYRHLAIYLAESLSAIFRIAGGSPHGGSHHSVYRGGGGTENNTLKDEQKSALSVTSMQESPLRTVTTAEPHLATITEGAARSYRWRREPFGSAAPTSFHAI